RCVNAVTLSFDSSFRCQLRQFFELKNEFRPAVRIAAVIERINSDENILCIDYFSPGQSVTQKNGISCRDICDRNSAGNLAFTAIFGNIDRIGQGGATDRAQINLDYPVLFHAERLRDSLSRDNFDLMPLAVAETEA